MRPDPLAPQVTELVFPPGVRRDGTELDRRTYADAEWVRFQRGKPRKMGGYTRMSDIVSGPARALYVDSRAGGNSLHVFSPYGIERIDFTSTGVAGGLTVRTPSGFASDPTFAWQVAGMYDSTGGGAGVIVASATPDIDDIASDATGKVYYADPTDTAAFTVIQDSGVDIAVSGGCCVLQPFLFVYGSNGLIKNSDANNFSSLNGWTIGGGSFANEANVAGTKIVRGLPIRGGGQSPAGLFWALDSLIRVSFVNDGTTLWRYDVVSAAITVLSKSGIVENDGIYFWPGVDRFYTFNGVVQELQNDFSRDFFFDSVNRLAANKVWAMKMPRFGEIWWLFPSGTSDECDHAVIYNYRENIWYDTPLERSAGNSPQVFAYPILAGGAARATVVIEHGAVVGAFGTGETVTGGTSAATGVVARAETDRINLVDVTGTFQNGETLTSASGSATASAAPVDQQLDSVWVHEKGYDRVAGTSVTAIRSQFSTPTFQYVTGGPAGGAPAGQDVQIRLERLEPDFVLSGELTLTVGGRSYAQGPDVVSPEFAISADTEFVEPKEQRREMYLTFSSNVAGGYFEMGRCFATFGPGDASG